MPDSPAADGAPRSPVVGLRDGSPSPLVADAAGAASAAAEDVPRAMALAERLGPIAPLPGAGRSAELWALLASLAARDLTVARVVEPHLDALAILRQAGLEAVPGAVYGVYAAERADLSLIASGGVLTGVKPWCSLAASLDRALVTARAGDGRALFDVDLRHPGVVPARGEWHARGLAAVESGSVRFEAVPATPVGEPGWYLERPGFAWGGIGVAACWYGGAVGVAAGVLEATRAREPDQIALAALGAVDRGLHAARAVLASAATALDVGDAAGRAGVLLAARVRGAVAAAAEEVLRVAGHALGPAPLTLDEQHARRVADLTVYLRQHHAERDDARLGSAVAAGGTPAW